MISGPLDSLRTEVEAARQRLDEQLQALDAYEQAETKVRELFGDDALPRRQITPAGDFRQCPECSRTFTRMSRTRQIYCGVTCRNKANTRSRGPRQRQRKAANGGDQAAAEADGASFPTILALAAGGLDLGEAREGRAEAPGRDQRDDQGIAPAAAGGTLVCDRGVIHAFTDDLAVRIVAAGRSEQGSVAGGGAEHDLGIDDRAGCAVEGQAVAICACSRPLEGLVGIDLAAAPCGHRLEDEDGLSGEGFDGGLVVAVDEGAIAEVDEAAGEDVVGAVAVDSDREHDELRADAAAATAVASRDGQFSHRPGQAIARPGEQREVPPRDWCARCGAAIDRETRRHSGYCSDECREEGRGAILQARKAGDPWQFALHPLLYGALGGPVEDVRLFSQDRERIEQQRGHAGVPVVSSADRPGARRAGASRLRDELGEADAAAGERC
jgi:hypothetical protein